jgi:hypothetical protein
VALANDIHISLDYLYGSQVRQIGRDLQSDPSDQRDGWYVRSYCKEGYENIVKLTRVTQELAEAVAEVIGGGLEAQGKAGDAGALIASVQAAGEIAAQARKNAISFLEKRIADDQKNLARWKAEADNAGIVLDYDRPSV